MYEHTVIDTYDASNITFASVIMGIFTYGDEDIVRLKAGSKGRAGIIPANRVSAVKANIRQHRRKM